MLSTLKAHVLPASLPLAPDIAKRNTTSAGRVPSRSVDAHAPDAWEWIPRLHLLPCCAATPALRDSLRPRRPRDRLERHRCGNAWGPTVAKRKGEAEGDHSPERRLSRPIARKPASNTSASKRVPVGTRRYPMVPDGTRRPVGPLLGPPPPVQKLIR